MKKRSKKQEIIPKQISNPYSTGGAGPDFEYLVQTSFVVLLLIGGVFPIIGQQKISKIELQNKIRGVDTDDLTVYAGQRKMLAQIKLNIKILESDENFNETVSSAWLDFNKEIFDEANDKLALITSYLSQKDARAIRVILDYAKGAADEHDFMKRLQTKGYANKYAKEKYEIIKKIIIKTNNGIDISDSALLRFLKVFNIFVYDFDIKGVYLSLFHSLIEQYECINANSTWCEIKDYVTDMNKKAGVITLSNIPEYIKSRFKTKKQVAIPLNFIEHISTAEWLNNPKYKRAVALASLIGAWNENFENDISEVSKVVREPYSTWIKNLQEILLIDNSPIEYREGVWFVQDRANVLLQTKAAIYDSDLSALEDTTVSILTQVDPMYELEKDKRYAAAIYNKVHPFSHNIRTGLSETIAILGCNKHFEHAKSKIQYFSDTVIRRIFKGASWQLLASLNEYMQNIAEGSAKTFIEVINSITDSHPEIIKQLVEQEGDGITGGCYISGLLWAIEAIAWDEDNFTDAVMLLGRLAELDPGSHWGNRPINSLKDMLLPWHYQTLATLDRQKITVEQLLQEHHDIGIEVLIDLLPTNRQTTSGTIQPKYLPIFPTDWKYSVSKHDYYELTSFYVNLLISQAKGNIENILLIIPHLNVLSDEDFDNVIANMSSDEIINAQEEKKVLLWQSLFKTIKHHKKYAHTDWSMKSDKIQRLESVLNLIQPKDILDTQSPLFDITLSYDLEGEDDFNQMEKNLLELRKSALEKILSIDSDISQIIKLVNKVETPSLVAEALFNLDNFDFDKDIYPALLKTENKKLDNFVNSYSYYKYRKQGKQWLEKFSISVWDEELQLDFFKQLPFVPEVWAIVESYSQKLKDIYWKTVDVNPYQNDKTVELINYLLLYNRPIAALKCFSKLIYAKQDIESHLIIETLKLLKNSEEDKNAIDVHAIELMIQKLQIANDVDFETLAMLEWQFYPVLQHSTKPLTLKRKLVEQPKFFMELICILYKPKDADIQETMPKYKESVISQAWQVLNELIILPGFDETNQKFDNKIFMKWFNEVIKIAEEKNRLDVTLIHIGKNLFYTPADSDGFWIDRLIAELLNKPEYEKLRSGYSSEIINSRGVYTVDPTAKPELKFANKYRNQAKICRDNGYQRIALILDAAADIYTKEAERIIQDQM